MTTMLMSVLLRSNLEWMSTLRLMLQTPIADHHNSRDKALDREDASELIALESKLDALMNLVTQLAANQKATSIARVTASVLPMTTIQVSILLRNNLEWMSILRLMLQTLIADHHNRRDKALDKEDDSQLLAVQCKK
ncbi:hypothetical protein Fmac_028725 [Flemingia macrophylla]|uniref:Uncharacterized protein n=1 Tax=Flemingia macrophylla TaxID=520843 RepID=A0ABD1L8E8_9FABA